MIESARQPKSGDYGQGNLRSGSCAAGRGSGAITEGEMQSHIDVAIFVACVTCMRNCPYDAIIYRRKAETLAPLSPKEPGDA